MLQPELGGGGGGGSGGSGGGGGGGGCWGRNLGDPKVVAQWRDWKVRRWRGAGQAVRAGPKQPAVPRTEVPVARGWTGAVDPAAPSESLAAGSLSASNTVELRILRLPRLRRSSAGVPDREPDTPLACACRSLLPSFGLA